jgi:hypothetical protein
MTMSLGLGLGLTLGNGVGFSLDAYLASLSDGFDYDFTKTDRHFQNHGGNGQLLADDVGEAIGLVLDQREWGGKTLAQLLASQPELIPNTNPGNPGGGALPTGWSFRSSGGIGTIAMTVVGYGAGYVDLRWAGTAASSGSFFSGVNFSDATSILGAPDRAYSLDVAVSIIAGSASLSVVIDGHTAAGAYVTTLASQAPGSLALGARPDSTIARLRPLLSFTFTANQVVNFTARVYAPSLKAIPGKASIQSTGNLKGVRQTTGCKYDGSDDSHLTPYLLGQTLGSELLVPGSWSMSVAGGTSTATESPSGTLNLTGDGTNMARGDQSFATVVGRTYRLAETVATNAVAIDVGTSQGNNSIVNGATLSVGSNAYYFVATSTTTWVRMRRTSAGLAAVSAISCKEVTEQNNFMVGLFDIPASIASTQIMVGTQSGDGRFRFDVLTSGSVVPAVGTVSGISALATGDLRGQLVVLGVSIDGSTVRMFSDTAQIGEVAQVGVANVTVPLRMGANNSSGSGANHFGGSIKKLVSGRDHLSLARYLQIRNQLLAA